MTWPLCHTVELLGVTYPARKDGSRFYLPVDCLVVAGQRIYHEGGPRYVLDVKIMPHAVVIDTGPVL